jgi:N-acetyl-1-D-myo-inositol-2-amino-2-deoxy-alpha-D-glucopyranoside deacetylase
MTTLPDEPTQQPDDAPAGTAATPQDAVLTEAAAVMAEVERKLDVSLDLLDAPRRLLLVHAHPDDETINNGATMAMYAAQGTQVTLVTCTLGEEGEVLVPELAHLAADRDDGLGLHRVGELATAMEALGVTDSRFLGGPGRYRDSGMMGLPTNERPDCFWQADLDEAAAHLVTVIREVRPQVLVTYDEQGGYGHPDHIQAHRVALRAYELAADPAFGTGVPWQIDKVYYVAVPDSFLRDGIRRLREAGDDVSFEGMDPDGEMPPFVVPDEQIDAAVDATSHVDAKLAAMRAHATQITVDGPFFALSNNLGNAVWGTEFYRLARGEKGPTGPDGREDDLFAGIA